MYTKVKTYLYVLNLIEISDMTNSTIERILDSAEKRARIGGYNAFSFREIAKEIGIKSASIHYHFPTKEILTIALVQRYTERFIAKTAQIEETLPLAAQLRAYMMIFREAIVNDEKMCLCGVLGAESDLLTENVKREIRKFFNVNLDWLEARLSANDIAEANVIARHILATLEGAVLLGKTLASIETFDASVSSLSQLFSL